MYLGKCLIYLFKPPKLDSLVINYICQPNLPQAFLSKAHICQRLPLAFLKFQK